LFGRGSNSNYQFYGSQSFPGAGSYHGWFNGGFPDQDLWFGLVGEEIPSGNLTLGFSMGDLRAGPLAPELLGQRFVDGYAIQGAGFRVKSSHGSCEIFGGQSRYRMDTPGLGPAQPTLYGADCLSSSGTSTFGAGVTIVSDPAYADPTIDGTTVVLNGRYYRRIGARSQAFGQLLATDEGGLGFKAGTGFRFLNSSISASVYSYDDLFPYVYPLYRPGERGIEVQGSWEPTELANLYGQVTWLDDDLITGRSELRGTIGSGMSFGSNRPHLAVDYTFNDLVYDTLTDDVARSFLAHRLAATMSLVSNRRYLGVTLERISGDQETDVDRTQVLTTFRQSLATASYVDGSMVVQRDGSDRFGFTAESAFEHPLRGSFNYLAGLGLAYVDQPSGAVGEAAARIGISRRSFRNGWYGRLELRIPFSIGLPRSNLNRQVFALVIGNRFNWSDFRDVSPFRHQRQSGAFGTIEGTVRLDGEGAGGLGIWVDGVRRTVTRNDGSYSASGIPAGTVSVSVELRSFGPEYDIVGSSYREVTTSARIVSRADFDIAKFSLLQGALVRCDGGKINAVVGVDVSLGIGKALRTVRTSTTGSFQFDRVPPGVHELSITGQGAPEDGWPDYRVDLRDEVFGILIGIECGPDEVRGDERVVRAQP